MQPTFLEIALIVFAAVMVIAFFVWRNLKDERKYERDTEQSEIKPEHHKEDERM